MAPTSAGGGGRTVKNGGAGAEGSRSGNGRNAGIPTPTRFSIRRSAAVTGRYRRPQTDEKSFGGNRRPGSPRIELFVPEDRLPFAGERCTGTVRNFLHPDRGCRDERCARRSLSSHRAEPSGDFPNAPFRAPLFLPQPPWNPCLHPRHRTPRNRRVPPPCGPTVPTVPPVTCPSPSRRSMSSSSAGEKAAWRS